MNEAATPDAAVAKETAAAAAGAVPTNEAATPDAAVAKETAAAAGAAGAVSTNEAAASDTAVVKGMGPRLTPPHRKGRS